MKFKYRFIIPLYLVVFFLQSTIFPQFALFSCTPNLLLCLTVMVSLRSEGYMGLVMGVAIGLVQDIFFGQMIGIAALCYYCLALLILLTKHLIYKNSVASVLFIGAISTVGYSFLYWGISAIMGSSYHLLYMAKMLPQLLIYNSVVILIMHVLIRRQEHKYPEDRYV